MPHVYSASRALSALSMSLLAYLLIGSAAL